MVDQPLRRTASEDAGTTFFDKAEQAESLEVLRQQHGELQSKIKKGDDKQTRERLESELKRLELRDKRLTKIIDGRTKKVQEGD